MADSNDTSCSERKETVVSIEGHESVNDSDHLINPNSEVNVLEESYRHTRCAHRRHSLDDNTSILTPIRSQKIQRRRCSLQVPPRLRESLLPEYYQSNNNYLDRASDNAQSSVGGIGSELFIGFLHEEINRSHLKVPECLTSSRLSSHRNCDSSCEFLSLGAHLRLMADEFASSDHRHRVREHAENIPLESLDADSFTDLLFGMFQQGGVTWERIVVLFVFCTDLALRALREHLAACFTNLMCWSQLYIESWLTPWVQRHGGWTVILERSVNEAYKAAVIGACMMGMLALWTYIRTAGR